MKGKKGEPSSKCMKKRGVGSMGLRPGCWPPRDRLHAGDQHETFELALKFERRGDEFAADSAGVRVNRAVGWQHKKQGSYARRGWRRPRYLCKTLLAHGLCCERLNETECSTL